MTDRNTKSGNSGATSINDPERMLEDSYDTSSAQDKTQQAAQTAKQKGEQVAQTAKQKTNQMTDQAQQKAGQMTDQAQAKADQGMDMAASGLDQAADTIRRQGQQMGGGTASGIANTAANTLDNASQYLRQKDTDELLDDLEALVRRKPVESVLVAAGVGFVLSKIFS